MVSRSVPAKRKQTVDMAESPPKRVTRARKAAAPLEEAETKPKITKATTAPSKPTATKKKVSVAKSASTRTTKRKALVEEPVAEQPAVEVDMEAPDKENVEVEESKTTTRSRQKQTSVKGKGEAPKKAASKRTRGQTDANEAPVEPTATKTRGRTKKVATIVEEEVPVDQGRVQEPSEAQPEAPKKTTTRTRATTVKTTRATAATRSTATKKKVQFQDEQDKENIPVEAEAPKKSAMKATGMRAKPTRKAAVTRTTRGRKAATNEKAETSPAKSTVMPLSPKKISQVAKTPSSSEDELAGPKSPLKSLSKSPIKSPMKGLFSSSKNAITSPKQTTAYHSPISSPNIAMHASVLTSPAKNPPQSPFKDTLRSPAKKFELSAPTSKDLFNASQVASPKKAASLLQESPKKVKLTGLRQAPELTSESPFKRSLLQSPARRPFASPSKGVKVSFLKVANTSHNEESPNLNLAVSNIAKDTEAHESNQEPLVSDVESMEYRATEPDLMDLDALASMASSPVSVAVAVSSEEKATRDSEKEDEAEEQSIVDIFSVSKEQAPESVFDLQGSKLPTFSMDYRRISLNSQLSEDELCSPDKRFAPTPLRKVGFVSSASDTPSAQQPESALTPLANQLSSWGASSPSKQKPSRQQRGIFSLAPNSLQSEQMNAEATACNEEASKSSFFEDDMAVLNAEQPTPDRPSLAFEAASEVLGVSMSSVASEEYGDENAVPIEAEALRAEQEADDPTLTCTPAKVFTPAAKISQLPREIYTVSKVPLRPSAEDSPLKLPRQRSKSLGGALAVLIDNTQDENSIPERPVTPTLSATADPTTPSSGMKLDAETPGRTGRKQGSSTVLRGAVVFVDVHTSEGADASGIFVDLLTQMGARCVKHWNWNPRASTGGSLDQSASPQGRSPTATPAASKVGITHVVYKDGGVRTLEKVRLAGGLVSCVGVGWVLDCEREDQWLDEAQYALDTSIVPRGGKARRKSMEPRALANLGGNLVPAINETPAKAAMSPTKEFLTFNTPVSRRDSFELNAHQVTPEEVEILSTHVPLSPSTPVSARASTPDAPGLIAASPTTPFYLSKGAQLVQQTCPPKQTGERLFPVSGNVEDEPDETVRHRLLAARRKTLQWSSKTQSPLGRTVSYGK